MRNIKLTLEYDGTDFLGFQIQKTGRTVQGELQKAVSRITNAPVKLICAARTDTGVHAAGQVVNFHTESRLSTERLEKGLNALCPADIAVLKVEDVPASFHARFSAVARSYVYAIHNAPIRSVFKCRYHLHIPDPLDEESMFRAAAMLLGENDFSSFRASSDATRHSIRRMIDAGGWREKDDIYLYFKANAFLQHMIRNIVGTLLWIGRNKIDLKEFKAIFEGKDRRLAGPTASPHGLCLLGVEYPDDEKDDWGNKIRSWTNGIFSGKAGLNKNNKNA